MISDEVESLLINVAQILDVVKTEWAESWSAFDQEQRDHITKLLTAKRPPGDLLGDTLLAHIKTSRDDSKRDMCALVAFTRQPAAVVRAALDRLVAAGKLRRYGNGRRHVWGRPACPDCGSTTHPVGCCAKDGHGG